MDALILAAGYATRMYPLTKTQPKSLLPIGSRVVIDWTMESLTALPSMQRVHIVSNAKFAAQFERWLQQRTYRVPVHLVNDGSTDAEHRLGAVRDMLLAITQQQITQPLLVSAGDHIVEWDVAQFLTFAQGKAPHVSVALYRVPDRRLSPTFGMAHLDAQQRIIQFEEKPETTTTDWAVVCMYYIPPAAFPRLATYIATGNNTDAPGYFIGWLSRQEPVYGWPAAGRLFDIGSTAAYQEARRVFEGAIR